MNPEPLDSTPGRSPPDIFVTTRWTLVLEAGRKSSPGADRALAELCQAYWYPLYVYLRRRGCDHHQAEDVTQGFFVHLEGTDKVSAFLP